MGHLRKAIYHWQDGCENTEFWKFHHRVQGNGLPGWRWGMSIDWRRPQGFWRGILVQTHLWPEVTKVSIMGCVSGHEKKWNVNCLVLYCPKCPARWSCGTAEEPPLLQILGNIDAIPYKCDPLTVVMWFSVDNGQLVRWNSGDRVRVTEHEQSLAVSRTKKIMGVENVG